MSTDLTATCPHCHGDEIASFDRILATAYIAGWKREVDGSLTPEYSGDSNVLWDTQKPNDPAKPYVCLDCDELLATAELVVA